MCLTLAFIGLSLPYLPTFPQNFVIFCTFCGKGVVAGFFQKKKEASNLFLTSSKLLFCIFLRILSFYIIEIDD